MKWGYASTAAIVRSLQKDLFYRQAIQSDLKLILLDHLNVGVYLKLEEWLPLIVDLFYYGVQTGSGRRTLGEAYSNVAPVDLNKRDFFLKDRLKRVLWVVLRIILPFAIKKGFSRSAPMVKRLFEIIEPLNSVLFYYSGKYPSIVNRFLSVRYIFYPRRQPILDKDALIYKGLAVALSVVGLYKLNECLRDYMNEQSTTRIESTSMKPSKQQYKCPVCFDAIEGAAFASIKCGHVYCWHCITKWMTSEQIGSCPVCRIPCDPPDLLPLANLK